MANKLTLTVDNNIIKNAKKYARQHKISLSKLIELYFKSLSESMDVKDKMIPPITGELSGMAKLKSKKTDRELLIDALNKKYL